MRYLIVSDLHSNLEALQAVLSATDGEYDQVVCCGDLVGYGPDPDPVVDWVRTHAVAVVRGNHDKACSGVMDAQDFNEVARVAAYWTRGHLKPENLQYLETLPEGPLEVSGKFGILHGSPRDEDEYVSTTWEAAESIPLLRHQVTFFGHTHLQGGFLRTARGLIETILAPMTKGKTRAVLEIQPGNVYFVNPGSVGQPRDRDNRAAFAIYDTVGIVEYGRVLYEVEATMSKMRESGLPEFLAYRLTVGR